MLIEISQEEYLKLQKIKLRHELLLDGILKYTELDYYQKELSFMMKRSASSWILYTLTNTSQGSNT